MKLIKELFRENKKELEEKIKEAEATIVESKKKLDRLNEYGGKSGNRSYSKNLHHKRIWKYLIILLAIIIAVWIYSSFNEDRYDYSCAEKSHCLECNVSIKCVELREIDFSHQRFYLTIENNLNHSAKCVATLKLTDENGSILLEKVHSAGTFKPLEEKVLTIPLDFPEGDINFSILPECDWNI